jgi:hypothetical protein
VEANNGNLDVTQNCWDFLKVLSSRRSLGSDTKRAFEEEDAQAGWNTEHFWADQICIDQTNVAERGHPVGLMGSIYGHAERVFAYVGPEPSDFEWDHTTFSTDDASLNPFRNALQPYSETFFTDQLSLRPSLVG